MIVERQDNGSLLISDMIEGYWLKEVYYFYSKKEAIKLFKNLKKEMQIKLLAERLSKQLTRKEKEHEPFLWNNIRVS
jgi:actin-related protein